MPREFAVPSFYRSANVLAVKLARKAADPRKKDLSPSVLDFGPVRFKLARHFGFCFGVENAIEIAYRVLSENPGRRIFLLSEVIHNPGVNADLLARGLQFLMRTDGTRLVDFDTLKPDDIVVVPAFGTTLELQEELSARGIDPYLYDATCPFVEKVWKRADELGRRGFTVIVHGKGTHEETRATFSHSKQTAPTLVVLDMAEAREVIEFIHGRRSEAEFWEKFRGAVSEGFNPQTDLLRVGVVNQTTMLASETKAISEAFRAAMLERYGEAQLGERFADTRDTLCYATYENQSATRMLTEAGADFALVVGGYNSSNTSHLVELCETRMPTFYIKDEGEILDAERIRHFDLHAREVVISEGWLPQVQDRPVEIAVTAGASCPDQAVDRVLQRVLSLFPEVACFETALGPYAAHLPPALASQ